MNIAKDIITISEDEISTYTEDIYRISSSQVIGKTDPFNGERAFILCNLEQLIGLLSFTPKNDKMIIQHTKNLFKIYVLFIIYNSKSIIITSTNDL